MIRNFFIWAILTDLGISFHEIRKSVNSVLIYAILMFLPYFLTFVFEFTSFSSSVFNTRRNAVKINVEQFYCVICRYFFNVVAKTWSELPCSVMDIRISKISWIVRIQCIDNFLENAH